MLSWLANFSTDHQKKKSITLVTNKEIRKSVIVESDEWRKKRNGLLQASDFSKNESVILERIPINVYFFFFFTLI